jgi:hypothetical protein
MPSHKSSKGTQASEGMARNAWKVGSSKRAIRGFKPTSAPISTAKLAPSPKPMRTRALLVKACSATVPRPRWKRVVTQSLGGGNKWRGTTPCHTSTSSVSKTPTGRIKPKASKRLE